MTEMKFWMVVATGKDDRVGYQRYTSYGEAEEELKRMVARHLDTRYWIMESIATAISPVPDIKVNRLPRIDQI